jgi:3',5'-cyclic-AMP phosphodiesterase
VPIDAPTRLDAPHHPAGPPPLEVTTVADDLAVLHVGGVAHRFPDLAPDTEHRLLGAAVRTLARPPGQLLSRVATVNDVHFGETECGRIDDHPMGPILRAEPDEPPYPETMNRAAVAEIAAIEPAAVLVKGDLTADGEDHELAAFHRCYDGFGDRLHCVRGNHDAYRGQDVHAGDRCVDVPGARLLLLDTVIPHQTTGRLATEQLTWMEDLAAGAHDRPVLLFGHHQNWLEGKRDAGYFGLDPDSSDALATAMARHGNVLGYFAGHTHRHRVRRRADVPGAVFVEVGCVKDFPGTWAEYRVFEGGILQVVHRISTPAALRWSERCRHLYRDFGVDYQAYALGTLDQRCFALPPRRNP